MMMLDASRSMVVVEPSCDNVSIQGPFYCHGCMGAAIAKVVLYTTTKVPREERVQDQGKGTNERVRLLLLSNREQWDKNGWKATCLS